MKSPLFALSPRFFSVLRGTGVALLVSTAHAQSVAPATKPAPKPLPNDAVVLSPFEVVAESDSYEATNTNSLTGISTSLNKAPVDARAITRTMMDELGGGDVFKMLSEYGGLGAMLFGGGNRTNVVCKKATEPSLRDSPAVASV